MLQLGLYILQCILEAVNQVIYSGKLIDVDMLLNCGFNHKKSGSGVVVLKFRGFCHFDKCSQIPQNYTTF